MAGRFEREGSYVYLWLVLADVWQKPTQHCKAIILQLKKKKNTGVGECVLSHFSQVQLFAVPWTALQTPLSHDSPGKNTAVSCHSFLQGIFQLKGGRIESPMAPALQTDSLPSDPSGK